MNCTFVNNGHRQTYVSDYFICAYIMIRSTGNKSLLLEIKQFQSAVSGMVAI